jgi:hypothetical protein
MHTKLQTRFITLTATFILSACQHASNTSDTPAEQAKQQAWPASLRVVGNGFPHPGDACRKIGESAATVNYLDHTATLAGCWSKDDAEKLGGRIVATIDGVILVSVPDGS